MNIGIDLRTLTPEVNNGVNVYTYNLVKKLLIRDKINNYKLFFNRQKKFDNFPVANNIKSYYFNIPNKFFNGALKFFNFPKIDNLIGGCDIYWLPNLNFISLNKKVKLVITIHDLSFKLMPELYSLKGRLWHKLINIEKNLKQCSLVLAVSEYTKMDLMNYFNISENRIKVIYPGLDDIFLTNIPEKDKINFRNTYNLSDNFFLTVATFEPRKNFETIILAFKKLLSENKHLIDDNWQLVLCGRTGWLEKSIYKLINKGGYANHIKIISQLSRSELPIIYQLSKIFVWPSYYEGFGFPPLEASKYDKIIITSDNSSLVEFFKKKAIYIKPFNVNELKIAMVKAIKYNFPFTSRAEEFNYSWDSSVNLLIETFNNLK